ncbi:MAG: hypothetical protein R2810_03500 [Flavobacteriales bacterium]
MRGLQLKVVGAVASTYFQLLEFETDTGISRETLVRDSVLTIIQARFDGGIAAGSNWTRRRYNAPSRRPPCRSTERRIATTEHALSILLGRAPGPVTTGIALYRSATRAGDPVGLPSELLKRRPDILSAEQAVAQNAVVSAAVAQRFPTISLTGHWASQAPTSPDSPPAPPPTASPAGSSGRCSTGGRTSAGWRSNGTVPG